LPHKSAFSRGNTGLQRKSGPLAGGKTDSGKSPVDLKNIRNYKDGGIEFNPNFAYLWREHFALE
jgi:hypothetical protein